MTKFYKLSRFITSYEAADEPMSFDNLLTPVDSELLQNIRIINFFDSTIQ